MVKVLFINGPSQDPSDRFFGWPTSLLYAIAPTIQSIKNGELNAEYASKIFDPIWYVEGVNSEKIKQNFRNVLQKEQADIICASTTYDSLYPTLQLFKEAKNVNSKIKTILGGPHIDETQEYSTLIDYSVSGDGEFTLKTILESIIKNSKIKQSIEGKSTIFTTNKIYKNNARLILDHVPFMPIELVDIDRHRNDFDVFNNGRNILPTVQMIAQRGCPYECYFCSEGRDLAYTNSRSIDSIIQEIELRKSQGFKAIFFDDSTFGAYRNKNEKILDLLRELKNTRMIFGSLNRFDHLNNQKIIAKYLDAGFVYVYCSIEQFDNDALKNMKKNQKTQQIELALNLIHESGMKLGVSLLYGLPYETEKTITATLDFTKKWVDNGTIALVSESILSFHPKTAIGKHMDLNFNRTPPNIGNPYNKFEEGQWYHSKHVDKKYLEKILQLSEERFKDVMIRNRHSWYAEKGYIL